MMDMIKNDQVPNYEIDDENSMLYDIGQPSQTKKVEKRGIIHHTGRYVAVPSLIEYYRG